MEVDGARLTVSAGRVSQWSDASGNARHYTQAAASAQPTYVSSANFGGGPALAADGAQFFERAETKIPGAIFVVVWNAGTGHRTITGSRLNGFSGFGLDRLYFKTSSDSSKKPSVAIRRADGVGVAAELSGQIGSAAYLLDAEITAAALTICRNASDIASVPAGADATDCFSQALFAGYYNQVLADFLSGEIAEVVEIASGAVLTQDEQDYLRGYMVWNNRLHTAGGGVLPVGHRFYSASP